MEVRVKYRTELQRRSVIRGVKALLDLHPNMSEETVHLIAAQYLALVQSQPLPSEEPT